MSAAGAAAEGRDQPYHVDQVIEIERECIRRTRDLLDDVDDTHGPARGADEFVGLALSGGGIRSATFNLGVLQALAAARQLRRIDYLSTVSGGGYIGAWLTAWIHRLAQAAAARPEAGGAPSAASPDPHVQALLQVESLLGGDEKSATASTTPRNHEPPPVSRLRMFSRYLAPRAGVLSLDSMTLVTTWLRNVFLNLLVMFALLGSLMTGAWWLLQAVASSEHQLGSPVIGPIGAVLGAVFFASSAVQLYTLDPARRAGLDVERAVWRWLASSALTRVAGLGYVVVCGLWVAGYPAHVGNAALASGVVISMTIALLGSGLACATMELRLGRAATVGPWLSSGAMVGTFLIYAMAGVVGIAAAIGCLIAIRHAFAGSHGMTGLMLQVALAPAFAMLTFAICGSLFVGAVGRRYLEGSREWWARLNAWFARCAVFWLVGAGLAFGAAGIAAWIWQSAEGWWAALLASGWVGSALASLFGSKVTVQSEARRRLMGHALGVAAFVFGAGLVLLASAGVHQLLKAVASQLPEWSTSAPWSASAPPPSAVSQPGPQVGPYVSAACRVQPAKAGASFVDALPACIEARAADTARMLRLADGRFVPAAFAAFAAAFLFLAWRVDVNRFSLHEMYKLRLVRCYLGASNSRRRADEFIGFDLHDDVRLDDIDRRQRPLHLLNAAVNLTVRTSLAWQQRKAASFTFSGLYCGFVPPHEELAERQRRGPVPGYIPTVRYGRTNKSVLRDHESGDARRSGEPGITLGSAIATSGAAVSPTSGTSTRRALAFILTLFNLRTGCWSPNPINMSANAVTPWFGWRWLFQELFAQTHAHGKFIHLSDGGHFDNLGIYELVRRRCRTIVCVDATADPARQFDDLGDVVRKCRVDLGVSIEIDTTQLVPDVRTGFAARTVVKGDIVYPDGVNGLFLYVKPGLAAGLRLRDLLTHYSSEPEFPHVATADQFFNESQFESYRRLGRLIGAGLVREMRRHAV